MKLEIKSCREQELSSKCSDVLKVIISNDYYEVAKFLNNTYYDDFYEVIKWYNILVLLHYS